MSKIIGWVVTLVVVAAAAYFLIPGFRTKVDDAIDGARSWDAEDRRKRPVQFIEYSEKRLEQNIGKFEDSLADLRLSQKTLERMGSENANKLQFTAKHLDEFKSAYVSANGAGKWPVSVAGASYTEADLKQQVGILLSQKKGFESVAKQVEQSSAAVDRHVRELATRIADSKAKLGMLGAQKQLVKANQLTKETEKILDDVNEVLVLNDAFAEKSPVRTAEELIKDIQASSAPGASADVEEFLKS
jgi:hypothetical protein